MQGERPYACPEARLQAFQQTRGIVFKLADRSQVSGLEFGDIVSELLLHLWRYVLPSYREGGTTLERFVWWSLKCHVIGLLRSEYRMKRLTRITSTGISAEVWESIPDAYSGVEAGVLSRLRAEELAPVIRRMLSPKQLRVIETVADGHDLHETAVLLGISYKSVDNALYRAREKFRGMER